MLEKIILKYGHIAGEALEFGVEPVTVVIGPNNSGKSLFLREIETLCLQGANSAAHIVADVVFTSWQSEESRQEIEKLKADIEELPNGHVHVGSITQGSRQMTSLSPSDIDFLLLATASPNAAHCRQKFCQQFARFLTTRLDGAGRMSIVNIQPVGDLQQPPPNHLSFLMQNREKRERIRQIIFDAFGKYFVIDPTFVGNVRIRLSDREPRTEEEELSWTKEARQFHKAALEITEASDGLRAFTGIITSVIAGDPRIILIDEPEAFLHPSLAYKLGKEVSKNSVENNKRLIVATHSSQFLMGCVQSSAKVNIVRLTYNEGKPTARILRQEQISELMKKPLLRSTGVLEALFYEYVIIVEGESDKIFYQEINERLLHSSRSEHKAMGIPNCLFINASGKQRMPDIIKPLRDLGISVVGICDIDIVDKDGIKWTTWLESIAIPQGVHQSLVTLRATVMKFFEKVKDKVKREGIIVLPDLEQQTICHLLNQLQEYGLFTVRNGELESWLKHLGATGQKHVWLNRILTLMGEDPSSEQYVHPSDDDVWKFIGDIKQWLVNPSKQGIPK
jgi:ABC-type cobalamin/Fe3+-siderophores transport system ATPase subunit